MDEATDKCGLATIGLNSSPDDTATDEMLLRLVREGDESAFEQIFERHKKQVARIGGRFFNHSDKVEEIIQEVFTKVYFSLDSYSPERGHSFAAWLSRITINTCYDELRRARRRPEHRSGDIAEEEAAILKARIRDNRPPRDAESKAISRDLADKLLSRLSADDRLVLTLLEAEGLSIHEISETVGWSFSKVKVRAHRARIALRRVLSEFL